MAGADSIWHIDTQQVPSIILRYSSACRICTPKDMDGETLAAYIIRASLSPERMQCLDQQGRAIIKAPGIAASVHFLNITRDANGVMQQKARGKGMTLHLGI